MSEAELIELMMMHREGIGIDAMNVTAVFISFLVAAYLVGDKIGKWWALALSFVYTLFMFAPMGSAIDRVSERKALAAHYVDNFPNGVLAQDLRLFADNPMIYVFVLLPLVLGWLFSLAYLFTKVRGPA